MTEDPEVRAWKNCHPDDLWIFDKLLLSKKFNYLCGPGCVPAPKADFYIVRPVMNLYGMGVGAEIKWLTARRGVSEELSTSVATASKTVPFVITTLPNPP